MMIRRIMSRGSNTAPQPRNSIVEIECATGVHVSRHSGYINRLVRGLTCD